MVAPINRHHQIPSSTAARQKASEQLGNLKSPGAAEGALLVSLLLRWCILMTV